MSRMVTVERCRSDQTTDRFYVRGFSSALLGRGSEGSLKLQRLYRVPETVDIETSFPGRIRLISGNEICWHNNGILGDPCFVQSLGQIKLRRCARAFAAEDSYSNSVRVPFCQFGQLNDSW
jgi:hypothetical protein